MKITAAQRATIMHYLRLAEFPTDYITIMFRRLNVSDDWLGKPVSQWMDSLSSADASNRIAFLKKEIIE